MLVERGFRPENTPIAGMRQISREGGSRSRRAESGEKSVDPRAQVVNAFQDTLSLLKNIDTEKVSAIPNEVARKVSVDPAHKARKNGELQSYRVKKFGDGKFRANEGIALNEMLATARASMELLSRRDREKLKSNLEILENNSKKYLDRGKRRKPEQYEARVKQEALERGISVEAARRLIDNRIELVLPSNRRQAVSSNSHAGGEKTHNVGRTQRKVHRIVRRPERATPNPITRTPTEPGSREEPESQEDDQGRALELVPNRYTPEVVAPEPARRRRYRGRLRRLFGKKDEYSKRPGRGVIAASLVAFIAGPEVASTVRSLQDNRIIIPPPIVRTVKNIPVGVEGIFASPVVVNGREVKLNSRQAAEKSAELQKKESEDRAKEKVVWQAPDVAVQDQQVAALENQDSIVDVSTPENHIQDNHVIMEGEAGVTQQTDTTNPRREREAPINTQVATAEPEPAPIENKHAISDVGIEIIKESESWSATVYNDPAGHPTIGWGHLVKDGENFENGLTPEQGEELLKEDIEKAINTIREMIYVPLNQNQFDALTSLIFNIGPDAFKDSTIRRLINEGKYPEATAEFARWIKATDPETKEMIILPGLVIRRANETARWTTPSGKIIEPVTEAPKIDETVHVIDGIEVRAISLEGHMLRVDVAEAFLRAQELAGGKIQVNSAGRGYEKQKELFEKWNRGEPGYFPADNPDLKRSTHMDFKAVDVENWEDPEILNALSSAGFIRPYPNPAQREMHHFELAA